MYIYMTPSSVHDMAGMDKTESKSMEEILKMLRSQSIEDPLSLTDDQDIADTTENTVEISRTATVRASPTYHEPTEETGDDLEMSFKIGDFCYPIDNDPHTTFHDITGQKPTHLLSANGQSLHGEILQDTDWTEFPGPFSDDLSSASTASTSSSDEQSQYPSQRDVTPNRAQILDNVKKVIQDRRARPQRNRIVSEPCIFPSQSAPKLPPRPRSGSDCTTVSSESFFHMPNELPLCSQGSLKGIPMSDGNISVPFSHTCSSLQQVKPYHWQQLSHDQYSHNMTTSAIKYSTSLPESIYTNAKFGLECQAMPQVEYPYTAAADVAVTFEDIEPLPEKEAAEFDRDILNFMIPTVTDADIWRSSVGPVSVNRKKRGCRLWEFIRNLLEDPRYNPSLIRWENKDEGTFKLVQSKAIAQMWGLKKGNEGMTYEKLSRAMRYYYKRQVLAPVLGRRLVYKFGPKAEFWKE